MISVVADLTVDPASSEQFRTAFLAYSEKVKRSEPGTLLYTLASGKEAGKFTVMELVSCATSATDFDHGALGAKRTLGGCCECERDTQVPRMRVKQSSPSGQRTVPKD